MAYLSHTPEERQKMLDSIGVGDIRELFLDVPAEIRIDGLDIPQGLSEPEVLSLLRQRAAKNCDLEAHSSFLGGGAYFGYVPAGVGAITGRAEFYTSYTPYQAEVSQGTLQVIYEFQSMIAMLTKLEVANASLYDGATAVAEAASMALNATDRPRVAILDSVNPEYRQVVRTYAEGIGYEVDEIGVVPTLSVDSVREQLHEDHAALIAQCPDYLGSIPDMETLSRLAHDIGALFISVVDPVSLAVVRPPGEYGADIAVGEGQNLGGWLSYGGPYLGFIAATSALQRRMPGRITGATVDNRGQRAFVLTLQTREQHIRRERATSNICTNEALVALGATVYLALVGPSGLLKIANLAMQRAHYAASRISQIPGFTLVTTGPFFREFAVTTPLSVAELRSSLASKGILAGIDLGEAYPTVDALRNATLLAFTDLTDRTSIDRLVEALSEMAPKPALVGAGATAVELR